MYTLVSTKLVEVLKSLAVNKLQKKSRPFFTWTRGASNQSEPCNKTCDPREAGEAFYECSIVLSLIWKTR